MADALLNGDDGDDDIFVYTGGRAPRDVRRAKICESIDTIPRDAFRDCELLIELEGHDKLMKIEGGAFYDCPSLKRVTKMNGVREIESHAFGSYTGCNALGDLDFDKLEIIGHGAFAHCKSLKYINLPSVRRVEHAAFYDCTSLTEAAFGKDLEIVEFAFRECTSLRRIAIPLKRNVIGNGSAFMLCESLVRVDPLVGETHKTISSLHMESWRDEMKEEIDRINQTIPDTQCTAKGAAINEWIESVLRRMEHYKAEHQILLKEAMTLLELALWKANLDENDVAQEGVRATRRQIKRARKERCITSGAGIIIKNVLPFLQLS